MLSFSSADTHLHFEIAVSRAQASEMMRRFKIAWIKRNRLEVGFVAAWHDPVREQSHLYSAFKYVLTQDLHHECQVDPYFEATALPDLLGMRVIDSAGLVDNVRAFLPRVSSEYLLDAIGLSRQQLGRITLEEVSLDHLSEVAAAAVALPNIIGRRQGCYQRTSCDGVCRGRPNGNRGHRASPRHQRRERQEAPVDAGSTRPRPRDRATAALSQSG